MKIILKVSNGNPYFLLHIFVQFTSTAFQNTIMKLFFIKYFPSYKIWKLQYHRH